MFGNDEPDLLLPARRTRWVQSSAASSIEEANSRASITAAYFFGDYVQHTIRRMKFDGNGNLSPGHELLAVRRNPGQPRHGRSGQAPRGAGRRALLRGHRLLRRGTRTRRRSGASGTASATSRRWRRRARRPPPGRRPCPSPSPSAGSSDPEGAPLSYSWTFGDGGTSTQANPTHTYQAPGQYVARLTVSDGTSTAVSSDLTIRGGHASDSDHPHPRDRSPLPGRRRDHLLRIGDRCGGRPAPGERLLLDDPLPPRVAHPSGGRAVHEHDERDAPDPHERARLPGLDQLRDRPHGHRLHRVDRVDVSDRHPGQGEPDLRHGAERADRDDRWGQQADAVRDR